MTKTTGVATDTGPFAMVPEWVLYHENLSAQAVRLYATLGRHADSAAKSYPSRRRLAQLLRVTTKSVDRYLGELEAAGAVVIEARFDDAGDRTSNEYTVLRVSRGGDTSVATGGDTEVPTGGDTSVPGNETHVERDPRGTTTLPAAPVAWDPLVGAKVLVEGERRPQDLVWNALAQVIDTDEPPHGSRMRAATATIRTVMWEHLVTQFGEDRVRDRGEADPEGYERALAESVVAVNRWLRDQSPGLTYGPEGFARNFRRGVAGLSSAATTSSIVEEALRASAS